MKKRVLSLFIVLVSFLFLGIASAASCYIDTKENCLNNGDHIVLGLSSSTNAHGELWDQTNYDYSLCCDFAGNTNCSTTGHPEYGDQIPQNKIIGLSSITNAHAEIPSEENYGEDICYSGLSCINITGECDSDYDFGILSLSGTTNAHIGEYEDYSTNICCNIVECRNDANPGEIVYCENYTMEECKTNPCEGIGITEIEAFFGVICSGENANAYCDCYWVEAEEICKPNYIPFPPPIRCGDQFIDETLGETCECGLDGVCGNFDDELSGDTCATYGLTGDGLFCDECKTNTSLCEGNEGGFCGDGTINPGETCDCGGDGCSSEELLGRTCGYYDLTGDGLKCTDCNFDVTGCGPNPNRPYPVGRCITISTSRETNCDENEFLSYTWESEWEWSEGNINLNLSLSLCDEDKGYIIEGEKCYYDPTGGSKICVSGRKDVPCPAQAQLPFFDYYGLIIVLIVVAFIYFITILKKKSKKANSKKRRK